MNKSELTKLLSLGLFDSKALRDWNPSKKQKNLDVLLYPAISDIRLS